jgi:hypothetical protein
MNDERPASIAAELSEILHASLKALAAAGKADRACRLAGRACAVLRREHPDQCEQFNKLLHRLSPMTDDIGSIPIEADTEGPFEARSHLRDSQERPRDG